MKLETNKIRNFCIIAHIDHGKSTLADRILEYTNTIEKREFRQQVLDSMELERERGITIKSKAIRINYLARDGKQYILNLIDTPGHVDFSHEVSRSLIACEGALVVIDATQGLQAQTISNIYLARENKLRIIFVINKIDMKNADVNSVKEELANTYGFKNAPCFLVSAKEGTGIPELLEGIVKYIPPPEASNVKNDFRALIFDSSFDVYRGVIVYLKVISGIVKKGDIVEFISNKKEFEVSEVGIFRLKMEERKSLTCGEVGYLSANIKNLSDVRIGDTIVSNLSPVKEPIPGYKGAKQMVFSAIYPVESRHYPALREALDKLSLNDPSFTYEPESSPSLGSGFRCGFLGPLHMEIIQERLEREYNLELISSAPSVCYRIKMRGKTVFIDNPAKFPPPQEVERTEEPFVRLKIFSPDEYLGRLTKLCKERRATHLSTDYPDPRQVVIISEMPVSEIIVDFHNIVKSITRGYGSVDYKDIGYRETKIVRLDILLNGERIDALACIVPREKAYERGRALVLKLKEVIQRQQFPIAIQAAIGGNVIARETIRAFRKDVTEKLYGGDVTRKKKLLEKQKHGKKRMKILGKVKVPQEAFLAVMKPT